MTANERSGDGEGPSGGLIHRMMVALVMLVAFAVFWKVMGL